MVAETAYVKDRVSGEGMFRERVAGLVRGGGGAMGLGLWRG